MIYGVTPEGFVRKRVADIRKELQEDFKQVYGQDLDVSEKSNAGAIIDVETKKFAELWEGLEVVYNNRNVNNAQGISLDQIVQFVAIKRMGATKTSVQVIVGGDVGTLIVKDKKVSQKITNFEFDIVEDVTISNLNAVETLFEISDVQDSTDYSLTIHGNLYLVNSGVGATEESIIAQLKVAVDAGNEPVDFTDYLDGTALIVSSDGVTPFSNVLSANIEFIEVFNLAQTASVNKGAISVSANTITEISTPVSGWNSVKNTQAGTTGRAEETDEELRSRRKKSVSSIGSGTDPAIEANLLAEVVGVTAVKIVSNRTMNTVDGIPPKSFECIISGGANQDIFDKIWELQPSGIEPFGNTNGIVIDSNGDGQNIGFTRPVDRYIWVKYEIELYNEEIYPNNGEDLIKAGVESWGIGEYQPGVDVIKDRLRTPVYDSVNGVGNIDVEIAVTTSPTDTPSYQTANIPISTREKAALPQVRISVVVV